MTTTFKAFIQALLPDANENAAFVDDHAPSDRIGALRSLVDQCDIFAAIWPDQSADGHDFQILKGEAAIASISDSDIAPSMSAITVKDAASADVMRTALAGRSH